MKQRIISALIMLPLFAFIYLGGIPLLAICIIGSGLCMYEFYRGYENINVKADKIVGFLLLAMLYVIIIYGEYLNARGLVYSHLLLLWTCLTIAIGLAITLIRSDNNIVDGPITSLGVLYIGFFASHLVLIDRLPSTNGFDNGHLVWLVFLASFGSDIFAYFVGCAIGKHKLCPNISPKKTVEGAIGGIIGSMLLCSAFGYFVCPQYLIHTIIIGFVGSFFAMAGDLIASIFKRKMGIKDYGAIIPGHGGFLDRFDSVIFVAPFVYYYILVVIKP